MNNKVVYQLMLSQSKNSNDPKTLLKELLEFDNFLYSKISSVAVKYGNGKHPKHRVTRYHDFFVDNVGCNESVLDLGSGLGDVTYDVACKTNAEVVGIELNGQNVIEARKRYNEKRKNLIFTHGDMKTGISRAGSWRLDSSTHFDIVIMSNVLEHMSNRVNLLKNIIKIITPKKILFRIPYFEREWMIPIKKELEVKYFLDSTHKIEYTYDEFYKEMKDADLEVDFLKANWGEIWAVCIPTHKDLNE